MLETIEKEVGAGEKVDHNQIAQEILTERQIILAGGQYYEYRDGVYSAVQQKTIEKVIKDRIGDSYNSHRGKEIMNSLSVEAFMDQEKLNASGMLNLKNGMLDLKTLELVPHSPEYKSTIQLAVSYNPDAPCAKWFKTLSEIFSDCPQKADLLQEFLGLCLTRETKYEKALFLLGEGANGKSTILSVLEAILGKKNYSSIPLEQLHNPIYQANLVDRLTNISSETNAKSAVYDSAFKAIVSGDEITVKKLYKDTFKFAPFCKMIFALNNMPRVDDKTNSFYRRLLIIRFDREFKESEQNKTLKHELIAEELDGIFIWMLNGLKRLQERRYFEQPVEVKHEIEEYRKENNNVMTFIDEECELEAGLETGKQPLYDAYDTYCKKNGYRPLSNKKFGMEIVKRYPGIKDGRDKRGGRIWEGVIARRF